MVDPKPHRLVVLGASNVAKSLEVLLTLAPRMIAGPVELHAAIGRGRSYGVRSQFLSRTLSGILDSELWRNLAEDPNIATSAVVTDIGNDLLYRQPVEQIVQWVGECVRRLKRHEARIVLTGIPVSSVRTISPTQFLLFRTLFFPNSWLTIDDVKQRAEQLNEQLERLANIEEVILVPQQPDWYGFDPLHWKLAARPEVWHTLLGALGHAAVDHKQVRSRFFDEMRHLFTRPAERTMFGFRQTKRQPTIVRGNHLTASLY